MTVKNCKVLGESQYAGTDMYEGVLLIIPAAAKNNPINYSELLKDVPKEDWAECIEIIGKRTKIKAQGGEILAWDYSPALRVCTLFCDPSQSMFTLLKGCRQALQKVSENGVKSILVDLRSTSNSLDIADAISAALTVSNYKFKKYGESQGEPEEPINIEILVPDASLNGAQQVVEHSCKVAESTNFVRQLTMRAANDLTPQRYISEVQDLAQSWGTACEVYGFEKLRSMNAGAFLAVAQASPAKDAGIVKLVYNPDSTHGHLCFVGKGVTFDTGGCNLKPASSMYGMERDMAGSAVALGLFKVAVEEGWHEKVSCFLAISDNLAGSTAYRPNDVVTAMSGKTIEIIHTDAEGRMLLADTLYLASQDKPDLIIDFATLTGACAGAIGSSYSGAFTNNAEQFHSRLVAAGKRSGERIWPFPLDEDFGECLKSEVADIKQCRVKGGVDHIEAAYFLKEFIDHGVPWIHIDLSAASNSGGLAHVGTDVTGYGVRIISEFLKNKTS